jgi:hypothetical protein
MHVQHNPSPALHRRNRGVDEPLVPALGDVGDRYECQSGLRVSIFGGLPYEQ